MGNDSHDFELRMAFARDLSRRRVLAGIGVAAAALAVPVTPAFASQTATPPTADQAELARLIALSQSLCGGGSFDAGQASLLLQLISADTDLARGLEQLYAASPATPAPATATGGASATPAPASRSKEAQAAAEAILLFWYAGVFKGDPIQDRASAYTNLVAWQAMYTPAWTTCKLYGAWSDVPTLTPQVPENA